MSTSTSSSSSNSFSPSSRRSTMTLHSPSQRAESDEAGRRSAPRMSHCPSTGRLFVNSRRGEVCRTRTSTGNEERTGHAAVRLFRTGLVSPNSSSTTTNQRTEQARADYARPCSTSCFCMSCWSVMTACMNSGSFWYAFTAAFSARGSLIPCLVRTFVWQLCCDCINFI